MRRWRWGLGTLVLVFAGLCALAGWQALRVRGDLVDARSTSQQAKAQLRDGDLDAADRSLAALRAQVAKARGRTDGLAFRLAGPVPVLGRHLKAVQDATVAADTVATRVLPPLREALDEVQSKDLLRDGTIDLDRLADVQQQLGTAAVAAGEARARVQRDHGPLVGSVDRALGDVRTSVADLQSALTSADDALTVARPMMGADGRRTYLVVVQNNAEARATGGLVGAFALVTADHGKVTLVRTGTDNELRSAPSPVPANPQQAAVWQRTGSTVAWFDGNLTPHWPDAASNFSGLWRAQTGQQLDGVIGIDPVVMSELLKATGPVSIASPTGPVRISSADVVDFVGRREYVDFPDNDVRKALLTELADGLFQRLLKVDDGEALLQSFRQSAQSGHLHVWSRDASEQQVLSGTAVGGALPADPGLLEVVTQNFGGNKLDFYLRRKVTVGPVQNGRITVAITLTNTAPTGLPTYMTVRADRPQPPVPYGQAKVGLAVYAGLVPSIGDVMLDGRPSALLFDSDQGHPFGYTTLELPRGRSVVLSFTAAAGLQGVTYRQQPLVVPDVLDIAGPHRVVGR